MNAPDRNLRRFFLLCATFAILVLLWPAGPDGAVGRVEARSVSYRAIVRVFGRHARAALRVARCESRLDPRALGAAGERGLFQIHPVHFSALDERRLFEPLYNARVAHRLSRGGTDWGHWTCRP